MVASRSEAAFDLGSGGAVAPALDEGVETSNEGPDVLLERSQSIDEGAHAIRHAAKPSCRSSCKVLRVTSFGSESGTDRLLLLKEQQ